MAQYQQYSDDASYQQQAYGPAPSYTQGQIPPPEKSPYPQESSAYSPPYVQQSAVYPPNQGQPTGNPPFLHQPSYGSPIEKPHLAHHQSFSTPVERPHLAHHQSFGLPSEKPPLTQYQSFGSPAGRPPLAHHQSYGPQIPTYEQVPIPPSWGSSSYNGPLDIVETHSAPPPLYENMPMQIEPLDKGFAGLAPEKLIFETQQFDQTKSALPTSPSATSPGGVPPKTADDIKHGKMKRFVGDTLVGRFARASITSASTSFKIGGSLSPWGDNNPVVLPNVRYRDAVSFVTVHALTGGLLDNVPDMLASSFGADNFIAEVVTSSADFLMTGGPAGLVLKIGILQLVEQAVDRGILEQLLPEEEAITQTTNVKTMECVIKNKLIDAAADLRYVSPSPAANKLGCDKGWFCPYLMASSRIPAVPRKQDFAIAKFYGPLLGADYALAHKLLAESSNTIALCEADPAVHIGGNRILVAFVGITPYRGGRAEMWSSSWRPGGGLLRFHLLNGCPALVLPVTNKSPILAWSPWTLRQMTSDPDYQPGLQHEQICEWLDTVVDMPRVYKGAVTERYEDILGRSVSLLINGARNSVKAGKDVMKAIDDSRAGVIFMRY